MNWIVERGSAPQGLPEGVYADRIPNDPLSDVIVIVKGDWAAVLGHQASICLHVLNHLETDLATWLSASIEHYNLSHPQSQEWLSQLQNPSPQPTLIVTEPLYETSVSAVPVSQ